MGLLGQHTYTQVGSTCTSGSWLSAGKCDGNPKSVIHDSGNSQYFMPMRWRKVAITTLDELTVVSSSKVALTHKDRCKGTKHMSRVVSCTHSYINVDHNTHKVSKRSGQWWTFFLKPTHRDRVCVCGRSAHAFSQNH